MRLWCFCADGRASRGRVARLGGAPVESNVESCDDYCSGDQDPLRNIPVDQLVKIVHDKTALVDASAQSRAQVLLKQRERAIPVENLHQQAVGERRPVQVPQTGMLPCEQSSEDDESDEGQVKENSDISG